MLPVLVEYVIWFEENRVLVLGVWARWVAVVARVQNGEICPPLLRISHLCFYMLGAWVHVKTYL